MNPTLQLAFLALLACNALILVQCSRNKERFSLNQNFEFETKPFLRVRHFVKTSPNEKIFNYEARVDQEESYDEVNNEDSIKTTINIKSSSAILNALNFNLNQNFSTSQSHMHENMTLDHDSFKARVSAVASDDLFVKFLGLFDSKSNLKSVDHYGSKTLEELNGAFELRWISGERISPNHSQVNLKIRNDYVKNLINEGFGFAADFLNHYIQPNLNRSNKKILKQDEEL